MYSWNFLSVERWLRSGCDRERVEGVHNPLLARDADRLMTQLTAGEVEQRGNGANAETLRQGGIFVHVDFHNLHTAGLLGGDFIEHGREHFARPAPFGPEVHQNGS